MKNELTELVFIVDRSGSMSGLETDTIGGFNAMLTKQQQEPGKAMVTTVLFDDQYEILHHRLSVQEVKPVTDKEYFVRGTTALLDAVGHTINRIGKILHEAKEEERPGQVVFVITTDGLENASREFSYEDVRKMIEHQKEKYGWEFIFLGANINAVATAERFGIKKDRAADYHADGAGTSLNYKVINETVSYLRSHKVLSDSWKDEIDQDFNKRKKRGK